MSSPPSLPVVLSPPLEHREAIIDALSRFLIGMDNNSPALFDSAFTADVRWELNGRVLEGLQAVHAECYDATILKLDTTHSVSNLRVDVAEGGNEAKLEAVYVAHHYRGGEGTVEGSPRFVTGGLYTAELVKDDKGGDGDSDGLWRMNVFRMRSIWTEGFRSVMGVHRLIK